MTTRTETDTHEPCRLAALHSLDVLDTPPEERFDRITRLARRLFDVPIALVSLVDADRQWFKSRVGLEATGTSRAVSFCSYAILEDEIFVVPDATADERFRENPLVTGEPGIRFYAGCPLRGPGGYLVGTLCVIDRRPREFSDEDRSILRDLGETVAQQLTQAVTATVDSLTGTTNRRGLMVIGEYVLKIARRNGSPVSLVYFDLNGFKQINDTHGHQAGDQALVTFARRLIDVFRESDVVARLGGDEFCVIMAGTHTAGVPQALERLDDALVQTAQPGSPRIAYSAGVTAFDPDRHGSIADLLEGADSAMYAEKKRSRSRVD